MEGLRLHKQVVLQARSNYLFDFPLISLKYVLGQHYFIEGAGILSFFKFYFLLLLSVAHFFN